MSKRITLVALISLIVGCSSSDEDTLSIEVSEATFVHKVQASGSLAALSSTQIAGAPGSWGVLEYVVPNLSAVEKGDVIARMQASTIKAELAGIESDMARATNESQADMLGFDSRDKEITSQRTIVDKELVLIDKFDVDIEGVYSKIEMIDKMRNKDYTVARGDYLDWDASSNSDRRASKQKIAELEKQKVLQQQQFATMKLNAAVLVAPHAGIVSLKSDWRQNMFSAGMVVFPGMSIAELPNYEDLGGELSVLSVDIAGITEGTKVTATLNAYPDVVLSGEILSISKLGNQKSGKPGIWHDAKVRFDDLPEVAINNPSLSFTATIHVNELTDQVVVPVDAVYREEGDSWVTMINNEPRKVELGARNQSQVIITKGLSSGERITMP